MKNHLWIAAIVSVSTFNVYAQENPFALQEKFQKIDKDTDALINSLKKIYSERKESKQVDIVVVPSMEDSLVSEDNVTDINISNNEDPDTVDNELLFKKAIDEQDDLISISVAAEEKRLEKVREEQFKIEEEKAKRVQIRKEKREAVEKEEEKKESPSIKVPEVEPEAPESAESTKKDTLEDKVQVEEAAAIKAVENEELMTEDKELKDEKHKIVEINATKDDLQAGNEADDALLKAMQEVD
jgi:hypothetical protein